MVCMGVNKIVQYIHNGPFHGKEVPENWLGLEVHDISHSPVDEKEWGVLPHLIFLTPFLHFFL